MQYQKEEILKEFVQFFEDYGIFDTSHDLIFHQTYDLWCQLIPKPPRSGNADTKDIQIFLAPMKGSIYIFTGVWVHLLDPVSKEIQYSVELGRSGGSGSGASYDVPNGQYLMKMEIADPPDDRFVGSFRLPPLE